MTFRDRVARVVRGIPRGETMTYKEVAIAAGRPRAWRAAGNILHRIWQTDHGRAVPCHRVVRNDGKIGGYAGGVAAKRALLASEREAG